MLEQETLAVSGISAMEDLVVRLFAYCASAGEVDVGTFVEDYRPCLVCDEGGTVRVPSDYIRCHKCDGTGRENLGQFVTWFVPCEKCHGTGWSPAPPVHK